MADFFRNIDPGAEHNTLGRVLWMLVGGKKQPWPKWVEYPKAPKPPERVEGAAIRVTFINHATVLIQTAGLNILTDPHYSERSSPFSWIGPKRAHAPGVAFEDLPPIDLILLSHDHYDHMDVPTLKRLFVAHPAAVLVTGTGVGRHLPHGTKERVVEMYWWETLDFKGLPVTFVPVRHFSARGFHDRFKTLWGGFVLQAPGGPIYFPGDSGYGRHFKKARDCYGPIKMAILPIGAYEPRWFMEKVHVNPAEAVQAFQDLEAESAVAVHWGCFQLTYEGINEPTTALKQALDAAKIPPDRFRALLPGQGWQV